jgi:hypothetical protein
MRRNRLKIFPRRFAGLLSALLFAISAIPLGARVAPETQIGRASAPAYDMTHETILVGTIQKVITEQVAAGPAGMHLLVACGQGVVDTHLGPFLTQQTTKDALNTGAPLQIVGASIQLGDKEYFLAREPSIGGRTITIRNKPGALVYPNADRGAKTSATAPAEKDGGGR